ncbi:hypothetical protein CSUB01_07040 [Colletotrichum sublineola]|uniref:Uncharacterized protein n=1 Tax=Colletotrichum sublineola TaxID=1173701 RepID=A0A066WWL7_COLSU|nr:hypothetical protein CSUB01_07040 [Colletotrichum sublineola]
MSHRILLPASTVPFAPRPSSVIAVLGSTVEPWLTAALRSISGKKRPPKSVSQHRKCLIQTLSNPLSIWSLAWIMLDKDSEPDLCQDFYEVPQYHLIHIEAYVIYIDMVLQNEVAFKLTTESISALVDYHKKRYCVDNLNKPLSCQGVDQQRSKLHEEFEQAINKFVYHADAKVLEGLEEDGTGELLSDESVRVKKRILDLMNPPLPPDDAAMHPTTHLQALEPSAATPFGFFNALYFAMATPHAETEAIYQSLQTIV